LRHLGLFGTIWEPFWDDFGIILGRFGEDVWIILGPFWDVFGTIVLLCFCFVLLYFALLCFASQNKQWGHFGTILKAFFAPEGITQMANKPPSSKVGGGGVSPQASSIRRPLPKAGSTACWIELFSSFSFVNSFNIVFFL